MIQPTFRIRRIASLLFTLAAVLLVASLAWFKADTSVGASMLSGCTLLTTILLLMLIGIRRRIPVVPMGNMSQWTQFHLYLGLFSVGVYCIHVPGIFVTGGLESWLSILFLLVAGSGMYGIYASRSVPRRLTARGDGHPFERGGRYRQQIAQTADELLGGLSEPAGEGVLRRFYASNLNPFFSSRPSLAYVMVPRGSRRRRLLSGLKDLDRYLDTEDRITAGQFATLVQHKDQLDYQFAMQLRLRIWLVVHGTLSIVLLVGAIFHATMVFNYR